MDKFRLRNHAFERFGGHYAPLIDPDHFLGYNAFDVKPRRIPQANIVKNDVEFILEVALPGFVKENIEVSLVGNKLKISAEKNTPQHEHSASYILQEYDSASVERVFTLAPSALHDSITANFENGVLTVRFRHNESEEFKNAQVIEVG